MKSHQVHPLVEEVLINHKQIKRRVKALAREIAEFYRQQKVKENTVVIVALLKGAVPFMSEFINHFDYETEISYLVVSSYSGATKPSKDPEITLDMTGNLEGRHVLVMDDVADSGRSLEKVKEHLLNKGAKDVRFATLVDKEIPRKSSFKIDWSGFKVQDKFLIGFGLDYQERLRNLPYIASTNMKKLKDWKWEKEKSNKKGIK